MSFQYFSIKYEIVSGSLLSFYSLCKESKKREAIKKRKPGNVASTASNQGFSCSVETCAQKEPYSMSQGDASKQIER